jgi:hypothetical protein
MSATLQEIERLHLCLLAVVALAAYVTGWLSPAGVLLGGAVMGLNVWLMRRAFGLWLGPGRGRRAPVILGLGLLKQGLFLGLVALLFWRVRIDALALAVGVSLLLVASVVASLRPRRALA